VSTPAPITSFRNPRVKALRALSQRKYREGEGRFLVEGIRIVEEALDCGAPVEQMVYAPDLLVIERAQALVRRVDPDRHLILAADVFASLSERDNPQGIAAVIRARQQSLDDIPVSDDMLALVLFELHDPGNLGSIIRTADAAGAAGVVIVEPAADPTDPQAVRATMGSLFALPVVRLPDGSALPGWYDAIRRALPRLLVVGSSAHGEIVYDGVPYDRPVVLLIGSERYGLPPAVRETADVDVRLPMAGRATSLNVSAATAALVYEIVRQRRHRSARALD
jgi:TrmH family RNA methyltransferase